MSDSLSPQGLCSPWNSPGQNTGVDSLSLTPGDLLNLRVKPRCPALQANSLPAEPQGKPKNIGVGSLSLLQWIFPAQGSNQCLLYCRWILYQLSYQGSPVKQLYPNSITASYLFLIGLKKYMKQQLFSPLPPRCIHIMNI